MNKNQKNQNNKENFKNSIAPNNKAFQQDLNLDNTANVEFSEEVFEEEENKNKNHRNHNNDNRNHSNFKHTENSDPKDKNVE